MGWQADNKTVRGPAGRVVLGMVILALCAGCAAPKTGALVEQLSDGRQGFVVRERTEMDAGARRDFERAVALMNEGKNEEALGLLTTVIQLWPGVTAPHINSAIAYLRTGRADLAEQHFRTALGLVPGHPAASNGYGLLLRRAGRFAEAREVYEKAAAGFPDYLPVRRNLGILCDLYLNDPECALEQFEACSEQMPGDKQVKIWVDELRLRLGKK